MQSKELVRSVYKEVRLRMSRSEVSSKSRTITRKLINDIAWSSYSNVCFFDPISSLNEVDISALKERVGRHSNLKVYVISDHKQAIFPDMKFDLILVPVLAFDKDNHRLGWGGGWYDKFLSKQPKALKIGLCFQNGFVEEGIPHEPHDIPLDKILTEI
jgi:5-formyltetrahydrofolate cyclo-ligase